MWEIFSKIGSLILVVFVLGTIYLVLYAEKEIQQDVLDYSLNLLGEKLMALVPEGAGKAKLNDLYTQFRKKAVEGEIEPNQIEHITAHILNVSNTENSLTPQEAAAVIQSSLFLSEPVIPPRLPDLPKVKVAIKQEERDDLGKRIKTIFEFNESIRHLMREQSIKQDKMSKHVHYYVNNGLRLELDDSLKFELSEKDFKKMSKKFLTLENMELLEWRKNLSVELEKERQTLQLEIDSLQKILTDSTVENALEMLKHLEFMKHLPALKNIPAIVPDSIHRLVKKNQEIEKIEKVN